MSKKNKDKKKLKFKKQDEDLREGLGVLVGFGKIPQGSADEVNRIIGSYVDDRAAREYVLELAVKSMDQTQTTEDILARAKAFQNYVDGNVGIELLDAQAEGSVDSVLATV